MSRSTYLLDTSALLTLMENEAGADRVEAILRMEDVLIPCTALLEVYYITCRRQGEAEADRRYAMLKVLSATILWELDEPTILHAGRIKAAHSLSFADAVAAAMAAQNDAILVHKDPEFDALANQVRLESLPYKANKA
ncbi:MAG: PIN domain-containing protein [Anaerolineae bacterium]